MTASVPLPTYPDLAGSVAVVTGGSRGIGAATCRALSASGAKVAVGGRDEVAIDTVVAEIRCAGGEAMAAGADCTDLAALQDMRARVAETFGPVDVLAAFAGGGTWPVPFPEITEDAWRATVDANLTATFLTLKTFLPGMSKRGRGSIVTMASTAGRAAGPGPVAYAAAKAGVVMLSRDAALENAGRGVRVNCVAPGAVRTERMAQQPQEVRERAAGAHPLGRLGEPADVAAATLFLASQSASWITGVTLDVTGGRIML
jgi:3-oxoacyl-[acyl-carrier protein] reductase